MQIKLGNIVCIQAVPIPIYLCICCKQLKCWIQLCLMEV